MTLPKSTTITRHIHNPADTITLDETARHRRRVKMVSDNGTEFLLDLPEARLLRHGDGLVLDDGRVIQVLAEPEALFEVRGSDACHLLRLTWHMGNRHLPTQIMEDHIRIRRDHVIKSMLEGLGAVVTEIEDAFDPEGGAYGSRPHAHGSHQRHEHNPVNEHE